MTRVDDDDRREASKLLVEVAKVAVTLSAGAIAVNGTFLREQSPGDLGFWFFLGSIVAFIVSILLSLTAVTRTIERAGGDRKGRRWDYAREKGLLQSASASGGVGIVLFVAGTVFN
jgi:hypothetical protein